MLTCKLVWCVIGFAYSHENCKFMAVNLLQFGIDMDKDDTAKQPLAAQGMCFELL